MIRLRTANKQDIPAILRIYSHYVMNTAVSFEYQMPPSESFEQMFETTSNQFPWLICEIDDKVAGYAYTKKYHEDDAYAWSTEISVYIDTDHHRKGIATFLYQCMEQFLILQGYYTLYASITGSNDKSLNFHRASGFEQIGTYHHVGYKLNAWHDVMWFEKPLREYADEPQQPTAFKQLDQDEVDRILLDFSEKMNQTIAN